MKKHFLKIMLFIIFFISPLIVKADFGDLRYEITNVNIKNSEIIFKGWAFIHKTNNYISTNGKSDGDQKVIIQAYSEATLLATSENKIAEIKMENYNFYCELFYINLNAKYSNCTESAYKDIGYNDCNNGKTLGESQCYYEDIYFEITFDTSEWRGKDINFKIAASNNDFEGKISNYNGEINYGGDYYTKPEILSIANAAVTNYSNNYIDIYKNSVSNKVKFIATQGILKDPVDNSKDFNKGTYYGAYDNYCGKNRIYVLNESTNYPKGRSVNASSCNNSFLGEYCKGTHFYAINVKNSSGDVACPGNGFVAAARGSHVKPTGEFKIKIKNDKKCDLVTPSSGKLVCNGSKTYNSTCNALTIHTDIGSANVKIMQEGNISSVLTPNKIYEGGGFNFGILYTNTIKWNYVDSLPNNTLHNEIVKEMNDKLIKYNEYTAGLNISNLKLGKDTKDSNFLIKDCKTTNENIDYYDKDLTVSCVFHFPKSEIKENGKVEYTSGDIGLGISNKYYTPFAYSGNYKITADIIGLNRIKESASKEDSKKEGKSWTGNWDDTFKNCNINVYSLLTKPSDKVIEEGNDGGYYKNGKILYNFIYRPIDITNPFPNRNAGINWYEWWALGKNREAMKETYKNEPQYTITLNNQKISEIKKYNSKSTNGYFDWETIENGKSKFVTDYFNTKRVGVE